LLLATLPIAVAAQATPPGKVVYDKWCSGCHGDQGAANGSGARTMLPQPRDFTKGVYKIRATASGELPTDADLRHVIEVGMPGTAMPEWKSRLSDAEISNVVAYIKDFSSFFKGAAPKTVDLGKAPSSSDGTIADGRAAFKKLECFKCHGEQGRGNGPSAPTLKDDYQHPIRAADLTENWKFRGGSTVEAIYARLRTGLDGTPMPSFTDAVENKLITDEQLWHVAQFVHSLAPDEPPVAREVVRAGLVTTLPTTPEAGEWQNVQRFWVPLVGQIIAKPRWFAPTIDGLWVQAVHDGKRLALRLAWDDPSSSPAPAWNEWLGRVASTMSDADGPLPTQQGPDRVHVQFPTSISDDAELPYFLGGSTRRPVYLWRWTSAPDAVEEGRGTALGQFTASSGTPTIAHRARFADGQWQVVFTRDLAVADTARAPRFTAGVPIPIAFFAADGSNGEDAIRGAVSTWYAIYLDVPTPTRVYVAPLATMVLSAGLGMLLVVRAQRRKPDPDPDVDSTPSEVP
jgi:DMSO reductase family type II enzyme heme b subunit